MTLARKRPIIRQWSLPRDFRDLAELRTAFLLTPRVSTELTLSQLLANAYAVGFADAVEVGHDR